MIESRQLSEVQDKVVFNRYSSRCRRDGHKITSKHKSSFFFIKIVHEERSVVVSFQASSSIRPKLSIKGGGLGPDLVPIEVRALPNLYLISVR